MTAFWIISLVLVTLLSCAMIYLSYRWTYITLLLLSACIPLLSLVIMAKNGLPGGAFVTQIWMAAVVVIPVMVFTSSIVNLCKPMGIAVALSITGILVSMLLILSYALLFQVAGAGMVG